MGSRFVSSLINRPIPRRYGNETVTLTLSEMRPHDTVEASFLLWHWQSGHPDADPHRQTITLRADGREISQETWPVSSDGGWVGGTFPHQGSKVVLELVAAGLQEARDGYGASGWEIHQVVVRAYFVESESPTK